MTKIKNVIKSDDYAVVPSDGVIMQIGDTVTKLIFYQKLHLPTDQDMLDQDEVTKVLQFEIRIPRNIFRTVAEFISSSEKSIEIGHEVVSNTNDQKIHSLNDELDYKIRNLLIDSNEDYSEDNEVVTLREKYGELNGRLERDEKKKQSQNP